MGTVTRQIYIISDLHLGGENAKPGDRNSRGFRICTHSNELADFIWALSHKVEKNERVELVLNGDTVDFLAERDADSRSWSPFTGDPLAAVLKFNKIVEREQAVFQALHGLLERGGRLVVMLGNHDVELSLPSVREALSTALGLEPHYNFEFIYDGEAYLVGDALIEHGNRYDRFNQVDLDALRRYRSLLSRRQEVPGKYEFDAPAGSRMVTTIINPIKQDYPFVDLLKPEQEAVVPLLLALEPGYRQYLGNLAGILYAAREHGLEGPALPKWGGDIASEQEARYPRFGEDISAGAAGGQRADLSREGNRALAAVFKRVLGTEAEAFQEEIEQSCTDEGREEFGTDISGGDGVERAWGLVRLLTGRKSAPLEKRMPALLKALRGLQSQDTFRTDIEDAAEYLEAARELANHGIRYVVFGHTHKAKRVPLGNGSFYLNSGTWADLMRFPTEMLSSPEPQALGRLRTFVDYLSKSDFSPWTLFHPTYIRLDLGSQGTVVAAELCEYSGRSPQ